MPTGFATTAHAFRQFLAHDGLAARINAKLCELDTEYLALFLREVNEETVPEEAGEIMIGRLREAAKPFPTDGSG